MNRKIVLAVVASVCAIVVCLFCVKYCGGEAATEQTRQTKETTDASEKQPSKKRDGDKAPDYAARIIKAYPDFHLRYADSALVFQDGTRIVCDDGRKKSFVQRLDDCDIEDMFASPYKRAQAAPEYLSDCGRGRCEKLFMKMYGASADAVKQNLVSVEWFGGKVLFTKVNGANKQLEKVAKELANKPELKKYLTSSGTFLWRKVRGANRQSAHSYGIAIDIGVAYSNYWLWENPGAKETDKLRYKNRIPMEIVKAFEKHGFIWGGSWYHYDTMHFEYRPELLS
jgi:peptidoglycan LD-endopeptidase CwlK